MPTVPFSTPEQSIDEGSIVNLFEFITGDEIHRKCNQDFDITIDSVVWEHSSILRSGIQASDERIQNEMKISLPRDDKLVVPHIRQLLATVTFMTVYEVHWDGYGDQSTKRVIWMGDCQTVSFDGAEATMIFQNLLSSLNKTGLRRKYQPSCPHYHYRGECGLAILDWSTDFYVQSKTGRSYLLPSLPADAETKYMGGIAQWGGQYRMIEDVDYSAKTITLLQDFNGFVPPEHIMLALGCDHSMSVCNGVFNNLTNFGGFPYIPDQNYFVTGVA